MANLKNPRKPTRSKTDNIKLLVVGIRFPPETFIMNKLRALAARGCQVTAYAAGGSHREKNLVIKNHRTWNTLNFFQKILYPPWLAFFSFIKAPRRSYQIIKIAVSKTESLRVFTREMTGLLPLVFEDLDILHFEWNSAAAEYELLFEFFHKPVVISCRGAQVSIAPHNPERSEQVSGFMRTLKKANAVHCVSKAIAGEVRNLVIDTGKIFINRPAVDSDFFSPNGSEPVSERNKPVVISVGSLIWRKGYEYGLQAIRILKDRGVDITYRIIGDGIEEERLFYTIDDLDLGNVVELKGALSPKRVRAELRKAGILILPSVSEGISNSILEAMACALPVVTTDCGGMCEAVSDGVEGFVVPVRDPAAMAEKMELLIKNSDLRTEMGKAGRARIEKEFTIERQADVFMEEYKKLIKNSG